MFDCNCGHVLVVGFVCFDGWFQPFDEQPQSFISFFEGIYQIFVTNANPGTEIVVDFLSNPIRPAPFSTRFVANRALFSLLRKIWLELFKMSVVLVYTEFKFR